MINTLFNLRAVCISLLTYTFVITISNGVYAMDFADTDAPLHQASNRTVPIADFILHCPTDEELTQAANLLENKDALQFKYQDKKTSLTWDVWSNAREPYKFKGVDIVESSNTPFIVAHYTNLQGEGTIHVTLSTPELYANHVISCKGNPKFLTMEFKNDNMRQYRTCTGIATDIDIICTTK